MKKRFWEKAVSLGLCAAMAVSLSACGKDGGGNTPGKAGDPNLAKQNVYAYEDIDVGKLGDSADVVGSAYVGGRVYMMFNIYNWSDENAGNENKILSFLPDGSDVQAIELENPTAGEENASGGFWINATSFGEDGSIYAQRQISTIDETDPENPIYSSTEELVCWSADGRQKWSKSLTELYDETEYFYISNILPQADGGANVLSGGDKYQLLTFDKDGNLVNQKPLNLDGVQNMDGIFTKADGTLMITSYDDSYVKKFISSYDPATDTLGEKTELPEALNHYSMGQGTDTDFILSDANGIYVYNLGDAEVTPLMNFVNSDLITDGMSAVIMIDTDHFVGAYYGIEDGLTKIARFTRVDPKDIPDKAVVTLGFATYLDSATRKRVVDFNKTNTQYRIVIRDYSSYSTAEDYTAGHTKLNNDIISGDMPDLLVADNRMAVDNFIAKGLVADIGSLIEKDEELSKVEFLENVFKAYSVNDKLYYVIPSFSVGTVIGKTSIVGERDGWTMADMQAVLAGMPEGTASFGEMTRDWFFNMLMQYCGNDFVDPSTGKCNFDSQEFQNVLEFAKGLPQEFDGESYDNEYWENYDSQYRENRTLLMPTSIYAIANLNYIINGYFGEPVTFIGFPKESGNGSTISADRSFILSARSKNLDGAWEFVRYYLSEDYQKEVGGMPVRKDLFLEKAKEATQKPYYIEDGKKVEYDETFMLKDGTELKLPPLSQEQVDEIVAFILSVDKASYYNESIYNIILEESAAFFADQKSAQEVTQIIQSRAQIYVNENR